MLLDCTLNSLPTVRLNIYQAFLLAAAKFHAYVRALPHRHFNTRFFGGCVLHALNAMDALIRRRTKLAGARCAVPPADVHWLGLHAFRHVLGRKQTLWNGGDGQLGQGGARGARGGDKGDGVLALLDRMLARRKYDRTRPALLAATRPELSPDFKFIKY